MSDYCEEEVWTRVFPHHKCQKILSKSLGFASWFGRNFLARVVRRNTCSHFRSHRNHIVENYKKKAEYISFGYLTNFLADSFILRLDLWFYSKSKNVKVSPLTQIPTQAACSHWTVEQGATLSPSIQNAVNINSLLMIKGFVYLQFIWGFLTYFCFCIKLTA